jgi:hypothetical protein
MFIRTSILALVSIAALATTAFAPTSASAFADGSVRFRHFAGHSHYGFFYNRTVGRYDPYKT